MTSKEAACLFIVFLFINFSYAVEENVEISISINVKKTAHCVSERFLSLSVDPAVLLAGVNLSENSLRLAQHLSPAYIRLAGPSTQFLQYLDQDDKSENFLSEDGNYVKITPTIWFGVNEWLRLAKLTPIFGINDAEIARGLWNPKSVLPLFEISEKLNVSCYWQLGYDSSNKNETRYKQDINIFHYILTAYGASNDTWKIIGSDVSTMPSERVENLMMELNDVVEAVMWEPSGRLLETFPEKDTAYKILLHQSAKPKTKLWTTVPKSTEPICFGSTLLWAKQVGNAAKMGYHVVFRQPRIYELFTDTPIYWFSLLHKHLMGCYVLDTKSPVFQEESDIFAQCTRKQNSFVRRGALTVMIVNDRLSKYKVKIKLGNSFPEKSMEVQSYILTSTSKNSSDIFLNGKKLTTKIFQEKELFKPKIRRTKVTSHLLLSLPPTSVGFFVLPGARVPVCIEHERETQLLIAEIEENQKNPLSEEIALRLGSRTSFSKNNLLEEIAQSLKDEMKSDDKYYKTLSEKLKSNVINNSIHDAAEEKIDEKRRKFFLDRYKHKKVLDVQKKGDGFKRLFTDKSQIFNDEQKPKTMDLTSNEVAKILKGRAVERAAKKNIAFTDAELDTLIRKASRSSKIKRSLTVPRNKRDINMHLLEKHSRNNNNYPHEFDDPTDGERKRLNVRNRRYIQRKKKRDINFDLLDVKSKLAERKRIWQDKKEDLLGNTKNIKDIIKNKIQELKTNLRWKRDINMNLVNKHAKSAKKVKKSNKKITTNEEIEATIRKDGQTSAEILEELQHADNNEKEASLENKVEVFAELANSEDLEDEMLDEMLFNNEPKPKKLSKLFDKKTKIDPFAVERPSIDIVEPIRMNDKKRKSKSKTKSEDRLQFLTASDEFTDVEDDLPCIHEFFGTKTNKAQKKKSRSGEIQEMNDFYTPKLFKRDTYKIEPKEISRNKRAATYTILEIGKFDDDILPTDLFPQPVLEIPFINQLFGHLLNFSSHKPDNKLLINNANKGHTNDQVKSNLIHKMDKPNEETVLHPEKGNFPNDEGIVLEMLVNSVQLNDDSKDKLAENSKRYEYAFNEINPTEKFNKSVEKSKESEQKVNLKPYSDDQSKQKYDDIMELSIPEDFETAVENLESPEMLKAELHHLRKRETFEEHSDDKQKRKKTKKPVKKTKPSATGNKKEKKEKESVITASKNKPNPNKHMKQQINIIRDKLQERKDEIDKVLKKQKQLEHDIKEQWKSKLSKSKKHINDQETEVEPRSKKSKSKRSIYKNRNILQPTDLPMWRPTELSSKKDFSFPKKLSKSLFNNKLYSIRRKRRFIDTDADFFENGIDATFNEIIKESMHDEPLLEHTLVKPNIKVYQLESNKDITFKSPENKTTIVSANETKNTSNNINDIVENVDFTNQDHISNQTFNNTNFPEEVLILNADDGNASIEEAFEYFELDPFLTPSQFSQKSNELMKNTELKLKLPNADEFDIRENGDNTEIKFLHHDVNQILIDDENIENLKSEVYVPKITTRTVLPVHEIEKAFNKLKEVFENVGEEVKKYFRNLGISF